MKVAVILPAAGKGTRFAQAGGDPSKVELPLEGRPVFQRAVELFTGHPLVGQIILAVHPQQLESFRFKWGDRLDMLGVTLIAGGEVERWQTVQRALDAVLPDFTHIAVHDAARPLTTRALIDRVFNAAEQYPAVIPGAPVNATLKRVTKVSRAPASDDPLDALLGAASQASVEVQQVAATVDRSDIVEVQTPQVFEQSLLRRAYATLASSGRTEGITDDAGLVERLGEPVYVVEGESTNLKLTRPDDVLIAAAIVRQREAGAETALGAKRLFANLDDE